MCNNPNCQATTTILSVVTGIDTLQIIIPLQELVPPFGHLYYDIQYLINSHWILQKHHGQYNHMCSECNSLECKLIRRCHTHPILLHVGFPLRYFTSLQLDMFIIYQILIFDGVSYTLSSATYGNGGPFITRFRYNDQVYQGDGMRTIEIQGRNYQRTDCVLISTTDTTFPGHFEYNSSVFCICTVDYIRTDSLII